jgi:predicted HicB family RNase H-like nuclease
MPDALKIFNLRLPQDMHADLTAMAVEQDRSLHNMVIVILRSAIEQWKKDKR